MPKIDTASSINVAGQFPLDYKTYFKTLSELENLGNQNSNAFVYYEGMIVFCLETEKNYRWKQIQFPFPQDYEGVLSTPFLYPQNSISNGIDYSNRYFDFVETEVQPQQISLITNVGDLGIDIYKGFNSVTNANEIKRITNSSVGAKFLYNNPLEPNNIAQRSLASQDCTVSEQGTSISINTENINENVGSEAEIYKGYSNNKHQFRTLESTDQSVEISNDNDKVDFKVYNPVTNLGAFITLNIGGGTVGDTFEVRGDITAAELTFVDNNQSEVLITLANNMLNDDYFVRAHFRSLDGSLSNDPERFSYTPITKEHLVNAFKIGFAKGNIAESPDQQLLVVLEVVQSAFNFNLNPPNEQAEFQIAIGTCANFDASTATWEDIFTDDALNLDNGDIIYTDFAKTIPFSPPSLPLSFYRLRKSPLAPGNPFLLDKSFNIGDGLLNALGEVIGLNSCVISTNAYEYAIGDCTTDTNDSNLTWLPLYATRLGVELTGEEIQQADILFTDAALTSRLTNEPNIRIRFINLSVIANSYNTDLFGIVGLPELCVVSSLRVSGSEGDITIKDAEPNEVITLRFELCTSANIGDPCFGNNFGITQNLPDNDEILLAAGVISDTGNFTVQFNGEFDGTYTSGLNSGNPTPQNVTVTVIGRSSGLPDGQTTTIIINE